MLQLLWDMFKETGRVNTYMFYKALEQDGMDEMEGMEEIEKTVDEMEKNVPGVSDGKPIIGQIIQLKDQA